MLKLKYGADEFTLICDYLTQEQVNQLLSTEIKSKFVAAQQATTNKLGLIRQLATAWTLQVNSHASNFSFPKSQLAKCRFANDITWTLEDVTHPSYTLTGPSSDVEPALMKTMQCLSTCEKVDTDLKAQDWQQSAASVNFNELQLSGDWNVATTADITYASLSPLFCGFPDPFVWVLKALNYDTAVRPYDFGGDSLSNYLQPIRLTTGSYDTAATNQILTELSIPENATILEAVLKWVTITEDIKKQKFLSILDGLGRKRIQSNAVAEIATYYKSPSGTPIEAIASLDVQLVLGGISVLDLLKLWEPELYKTKFLQPAPISSLRVPCLDLFNRVTHAVVQ